MTSSKQSGKPLKLQRPDPWQYIIDHEKDLRRLCRICCSSCNRPDLVDEVWTNIILEKVPLCIERWDCERPLWNMLCMYIRGYTQTFINRKFRGCQLLDFYTPHYDDPERLYKLGDRHDKWVEPTDSGGLDLATIEVQDILGKLPTWGQDLLRLRYLESYSVAEIAEMQGLSSSSIYTKLSQLIQMCREVGADG